MTLVSEALKQNPEFLKNNLINTNATTTTTNWGGLGSTGYVQSWPYTTDKPTPTKDKIETLNRLLSTLTSENMSVFGGGKLIKQIKSKLQTLIQDL